MANQYKRFTATISTASSTLLTVPSATTAIVKSALVSNNNAATATISMSVSSTTTSSVKVVPAEAVLPSDYEDLLSNKGPVVLEQLDTLKFDTDLTSSDVIISVLLVDRN
tara:strand:+ start:195 stop:524 length:330 start_codon:yes stop_codon:yes gene_type:complete